MRNIRHISLPRMARAMVEAGTAAALVPVTHVQDREAYEEAVETFLRKERIALVDEQFRRKYADHLVYTK